MKGCPLGSPFALASLEGQEQVGRPRLALTIAGLPGPPGDGAMPKAPVFRKWGQP